MTVLILRKQGTDILLVAGLLKSLGCQTVPVREYCFCHAQNYNRQKALLSVGTGITKLQKRFKLQEQQSDIGLWFGHKRKVPTNQTLLEEISDGLEIIKKGIPQYKQEWIEKFYVDTDFFPEHGDFEYFQRFTGNESLKGWMLSTDQDTDQGKSTATLTTTSSGTALFKGYLNTDVPKDGITKRAGYCNIRSPYNKISFERQIPYDWSRYTHMYVKVRGDGRNYMLIVQMDRHFDQHMYDLYNFPLYTRGGPYWQVVKIPLASFFLAFQGRAQDQQQRLTLDRIKYFGITAGDGVKGPFHLEIDFIALVRDALADVNRDFKYELYQKRRWET